MASTYTPLRVELMATGENAGTWGTKTNTNLQLFEQLTGGYSAKSIAGGVQNTDLTIVDGNTTGTGQFRMIEFTGTITGKQNVRIPLDIETFYMLRTTTLEQIQLNLNMQLVQDQLLHLLLQIKVTN